MVVTTDLVILEITQRAGCERFGRTGAGLVARARSGLQQEGRQSQGGRGVLVCLEVSHRAATVQLCVGHRLLLSALQSQPVSRTLTIAF